MKEAALGLRVSELVEVKSLAEILLTLDAQFECEGLPFMPEMARYCGKQYRVFKRVDKTCDNIHGTWMLRRMHNTVLLDGLRCDGEAHGGCQAGCTIFWKEAWLRRAADRPVSPSNLSATPSVQGTVCVQADPTLSSSGLLGSAMKAGEGGTGERGVYRCQATELHKATHPISRWDFWQYGRDVLSGNVRIVEFVNGIAMALFNAVQKLRRAPLFPHVQGTLKTTPKKPCDFRVGELVRIKPLDDIVATLDARNRNRGLLFDLEMANFCGGTYRIARQVEKIINERTGEMMRLPNDCLILDGVACESKVHSDRLFCPRRIYSYWRASWLERV
jgi:hypothetical protein